MCTTPFWRLEALGDASNTGYQELGPEDLMTPEEIEEVAGEAVEFYNKLKDDDPLSVESISQYEFVRTILEIKRAEKAFGKLCLEPQE